jgi:hypothetical protein
MQMRPQGWLFLTAFAALGVGCATTTTGDDTRTARLPTGITLLASDRNQCAGSVAIDESTVADARRSDLVIERGQNAIIEVASDADDDDVEIEWTCVGTVSTEREAVACPEDTSHVRITRASTGDELLLECYGDRDG